MKFLLHYVPNLVWLIYKVKSLVTFFIIFIIFRLFMEFLTLVNSLNLSNLVPEGIILLSILLILIFDLVFEPKTSSFALWTGSGSLILAIGALTFSLTQPEQISFLGSFHQDYLSISFSIFFVLSGLISLIFSAKFFTSTGSLFSEFTIFLLTATLGCIFLASSNDLLMVFISLETLGFASYLMAAYLKQEKLTNEASLKYLLTGSASSGVFLYGLSWLYGISGGHLELNYLGASLINGDLANSALIWVSFLFILVGLGFKLSIVPFHQWAPDVYQGVPTPVSAFLSVSSKGAGLALTWKICNLIFPFFFLEWNVLFQIIAVFSMALGSFIALTQTSFKRLLGYSSIAQAGFFLLGLLCGNKFGYSSLLVYLFLYLFMNFGTFGCLILFSLSFGSDDIKDYSGLIKKDPLLGYSLALSLLSLAGMPPLAGFFGKLYLFVSAWSSGFYLLLFLSLITTIVSIYYTLKIVKVLFNSTPSAVIIFNNSSALGIEGPTWYGHPLRLLILLSVFVSSVAGIFLDKLILGANVILDHTTNLNILNFSLTDLYF